MAKCVLWVVSRTDHRKPEASQVNYEVLNANSTSGDGQEGMEGSGGWKKNLRTKS